MFSQGDLSCPVHSLDAVILWYIWQIALVETLFKRHNFHNFITLERGVEGGGGGDGWLQRLWMPFPHVLLHIWVPGGKCLFWCLFLPLFCSIVLLNKSTRAELGLGQHWKKKQREPEAQKRSSSDPQSMNHVAISPIHSKPKATCKILSLTSHISLVPSVLRLKSPALGPPRALHHFRAWESECILFICWFFFN